MLASCASTVVIVGAGIGGAVLPLDLGSRGWRVALVERVIATLRPPTHFATIFTRLLAVRP